MFLAVPSAEGHFAGQDAWLEMHSQVLIRGRMPRHCNTETTT